MSVISSTAYIALLQTAFGALSIVAMSCMATIASKAEERLDKRRKAGSDFLTKLREAKLPTAGISKELYYSTADRRLVKFYGRAWLRLPVVYLVFLLMTFLLIALRWADVLGEERWAVALESDWTVIIPALGFSLWLVGEVWVAFVSHISSLAWTVEAE